MNADGREFTLLPRHGIGGTLDARAVLVSLLLLKSHGETTMGFTIEPDKPAAQAAFRFQTRAELRSIHLRACSSIARRR
jgi:hypothetical protein